MRSAFLRLIAFASVAALLTPAVVHGQTEAQLKARLEELKRKSARAGKAYETAYWALDSTEVKLSKSRRRIKKAEKDLTVAQGRLNVRAAEIYRRDDVGLLAFVLGSGSFEEFVNRAEFFGRVATADAEAVAEVKAVRARLFKERKELKGRLKTQQTEVRRLKKESERLQASLGKTEREFAAVKKQLTSVRALGRRVSGVAAAAGPNGMVFPVSGSYYYADTWGASRSGGRRRHQGTDIMARHGTPCVAVLPGTVRVRENTLGGKCIWLTADNGWSFYYAHLQGYAVTGGRVRAGQVIGYVGSTGNASASAPHLHFEIHPGGRGAINPYPYLRRME